ncbi:MAG TPA: hypothetical protein VEG67_08945 [Myxococcota bacterium]|nr:hypothetical protein [Myxococcota bacterium]
MQLRRSALLVRRILVVWALFPALVASADSASTASDASASILSDADKALSAFHTFTQTWMEKLRGTSALQTVAASSEGPELKRFSTTYSEEVKPTGSADNPFVGILHYTEELYRCSDVAGADCTMVDSTPVTEIFRYQNGAWVY